MVVGVYNNGGYCDGCEGGGGGGSLVDG